MNTHAKQLILYGSLAVVGLYFLFLALIKGQGFFVPLIIAVLLAMLVVPIANKFEDWGLSAGWSAFFSDLVLIGITLLFVWVLALQIEKVREDWPQLKQQLLKTAEKIDKSLDQYSWAAGGKLDLKKKIQKATSSDNKAGQSQNTNEAGNKSQSGETEEGVTQTSGQNNEQQSAMPGSQRVWSMVKSFFGFLGSILLVFIYIFFFLLYRGKFYKSILHFVPENRKERTKDIIKNSSKIAQQYLMGKVILIIFLAILYSIGLSISGIKYAILISVLAAVFSLIPYVGNVIGAVLAIIMALLAEGGGLTPVIGVVVTFSITQFVESYILEPFVVGDKVNLNPVMVIVAVVFGEFIWGVPGMILAIPILGILKVVWDHIPALQPLGYTVGEEGIESGDNIFKRFEKWVVNKFNKS